MGGTKPWPEVVVGNKDHSSAAVVIIGAGVSGKRIYLCSMEPVYQLPELLSRSPYNIHIAEALNVNDK